MAEMRGDEETTSEEEEGEIDDIKTDQVLDYYCEFCKEEDLDVEAGGYCVDCKEYLCDSCFNAHRRSRPTRHHELLDQDHMPRGSPLSQDRGSKYISTRCKVHNNNVVEYYCVSHDSLVCTACFLKEHRSCDEIKNVLEESENIIDSHAHQDFVRNLRKMEERSTCMATKLHDRKENAVQCSENAKEQIRDATKEFHTIVDQAEQSLIEQMDAIILDDHGVNEEIEEISDALKDLIEETARIADSRRVCQLYIQMKEKQGDVVLLEEKLRKTEGHKYVKLISFEPNYEVKKAFHAACLGQIRVKKGRGKSGSQQVTADHTITPSAFSDNATTEPVPMSPHADQIEAPDVTSPQLFAEEDIQGQKTNMIKYKRKFLLQLQYAAASRCIPEGVRALPEIMTVMQNQDTITATTTAQWGKQSSLSRDTPLEQRLMQFLNELPTLNKRGFEETLVDAASNASLTITIVYNSDNQNHLVPVMECDLFLEDVWIANSGTNSKKLDCVKDVYYNAWTTLLQKQPSDVLAEARRLSKQDLFGPFMVSVQRMGNGEAIDSNASMLTFCGYDLNKIENNRLEDIILFERSAWSSECQKHAMQIINLSCKLNGLLLQWETTSLLNSEAKENVRCQVYIQKQMLGDSYGVSKAQAKQLAFEEALNNLYEKQQRVIQINLQGEQEEWIVYDVLKREADEMEARGITPELPVCDEDGITISSFVMKAAYERVKSFVGNKADELVFGPGMATDERNAIRFIGRLLNLKTDSRGHDGQIYVVLFKDIEWTQIFDRLSPTSGLQRKYIRVDKNKIPKFAEVSSQIIKQPYTNSDDCTGTGNSKSTARKDEKVLAPALKGQDQNTMTLENKLDALGKVLRYMDMDRAPPSTIFANAMCSSKLNLKMEYLDDEVEQQDGQKVITGCLKINSQFIARGIGDEKKGLKQDVFKKSIELLRKRSKSQKVKLGDQGQGQLKHNIRNVGAMDARASLVKPVTDKKIVGPLKVVVTKLKAMKISSAQDYISPIENAIVQTTPRPGHEYLVKEQRLDKGNLYYSGQLSFGPLVIGRGSGLDQKTCKRNTYMNSWHHLTTKTLGKLTVSIAEEVQCNIDETPKQSSSQKAMSKDTLLETRLMKFLHALSTPDESTPVQTFDAAASSAALTVTIVYRAKQLNHLQPAMECDLFLEDIWIADHFGSKKNDCLKDVYQKAWTVLSKMQATDVLAMERRLTEDDIFGPFMISVCRKGIGNSVESNAPHLKRYGHDLKNVADNRLEDVVVLEHSEWSLDRQKHAVEILSLTCVQNGLLLQWNTQTHIDTSNAGKTRCRVYIQHQMLGDSYGVNKTRARELAFTEALYRMYEKQRVIRINLHSDQEEWILYDVLKRETEEMEARGMTPDLPVCDGTGTQISSFVVKSAYERVKSFVEKKTDELVFGPGMSTDERDAICYIGRILNLKCDLNALDGQHYFSLFKDREWSNMFEQLRPTSGLYGKYFRVDTKDTPKSSQIKKQPNNETVVCTTTAKGDDTSQIRNVKLNNSANQPDIPDVQVFHIRPELHENSPSKQPLHDGQHYQKETPELNHHQLMQTAVQQPQDHLEQPHPNSVQIHEQNEQSSHHETPAISGTIDVPLMPQDKTETTTASMSQVATPEVATLPKYNMNKETGTPLPGDIAAKAVQYTADEAVTGETHFTQPVISSMDVKAQTETATITDIPMTITSTARSEEDPSMQTKPSSRPLETDVPPVDKVPVASEAQPMDDKPTVPTFVSPVTSTLSRPTAVHQIVSSPTVATDSLLIAGKCTTKSTVIKPNTATCTSVVPTTAKTSYSSSEEAARVTEATTEENEVITQPPTYVPTIPPIADASKVSRTPAIITGIATVVPATTVSPTTSTIAQGSTGTPTVTITCPVITTPANSATTAVLTVPTITGTSSATKSEIVTGIPVVGTKTPAISSSLVETDESPREEETSTLLHTGATAVSTTASTITDKLTVATTVPHVTDAFVTAITNPDTATVEPVTDASAVAITNPDTAPVEPVTDASVTAITNPDTATVEPVTDASVTAITTPPKPDTATVEPEMPIQEPVNKQNNSCRTQ